ncbi:hypothetical protein ACSTD8_20940 [Vibrio vulnificus]|uniref:hypothetical protein n=1 Tax=Vibrio vulnificus TaxID=672 RepID=UPI003ED8F2B5
MDSSTDKAQKQKLKEERSKYYQMVMQYQLSIRLRINKDDKNETLRNLNKELLSWLDNVATLADDKKYDDCRACVVNAQEIASKILKLEWERVKSGEKAYRYTIYTSVPLLLVGLGGICTLAFRIFA